MRLFPFVAQSYTHHTLQFALALALSFPEHLFLNTALARPGCDIYNFTLLTHHHHPNYFHSILSYLTYLHYTSCPQQR